MAKAIVACVPSAVLARTLTLTLPVESADSPVRRIPGGIYWGYEGQVDYRPDSAPVCESAVCDQYCSYFSCAHGFGRLWSDGGWTYKGTFVDGRMDGSGTYKSDDYEYVGDFKRGRFHGHGVLTCLFTFPNLQYEGTFIDGKMTGQFKITAPPGMQPPQLPSGVPVDAFDACNQ